MWRTNRNTQREMATERMTYQIHAIQLQLIEQCNQIVLEIRQRIRVGPIATAMPAKIRGYDKKTTLGECSRGLVPTPGLAGQCMDQDNRRSVLSARQAIGEASSLDSCELVVREIRSHASVYAKNVMVTVPGLVIASIDPAGPGLA